MLSTTHVVDNTVMGSAVRRGAGILGCRQGTLAGVGCSRCHNSVSSLHLTPSPRYLSTCTPYSKTQFCKCFQMQMFSEILILSIFADNFFSPHTITKIPIIRPLPPALPTQRHNFANACFQTFSCSYFFCGQILAQEETG